MFNIKSIYNKLRNFLNSDYKKVNIHDEVIINEISNNKSSLNSETNLELENDFTPYQSNYDDDTVLQTLENYNNKQPKEQPKEDDKEQPKEDDKEQLKEDDKEQPKEQPKEQLKEQPKEQPKEQLKEEQKEEQKEEPKEEQNKSNQESIDEKESEYKTLFDIISDSELKNGFDISSFKYLPETFMEIETKTFGDSINNPFIKLYQSVISDKYDFEDRCQGVRYMQRIHYTGGMEYCIKASLSILRDDRYPFNKRYYFFSNNDAYVKLDYEIVNECHKYVYYNFQEFNAPLLYKLLSAQFILAHFVPTEYNRIELEEFLLSVSEDKEQTINYRAECADILYNYGVEKHYVESATRIIKELGDLYTQNKASTIYTNIQNVHDTTINKTIMNTLRELIQTVKIGKRNSGEVLETIRDKYSYIEKERMEKIMSSLERIMIDTAKYEMLNMSDILVLVWDYICHSEHKDELEKRLLQELEDMDQTCSTGHLSRILNILSGYFSESVVKITLKDQLRSNIFARYTKLIKMLPEDTQEKINNELASDETTEKDTIKTFLLDFNIEETLYKEFVNESNMDVSEFYETYEKSIEDYFGKLY